MGAGRFSEMAGLLCLPLCLSALADGHLKQGRGGHGRAKPVSYAAFVYIVNQSSESISQYRIRSDGGLQPLQALPMWTGPDPQSATASPTGRFVYVIVEPDNHSSVAQFRVGPGGTLQRAAPPYFAAEYGLSALAVHPTRPFAYGINYRGYASLYGVRPGGALSPLRRVAAHTGKDPAAIALDPTGRFAYVANLNGDTVSQYRIGKGGGLTPLLPPTAFAPGQPMCLTVDPTGRFVYVGRLRDERPLAYRIGPGGALKALVPLNVVHSPQGQDVLGVEVNWSRHALYVVTNDGEDTAGHILQYRIGPDGRPRPLRPASAEVFIAPTSLAMAPGGASAYAISRDSLAPYHVRADGSLVPFSLTGKGLMTTPVQSMAHTPVSILTIQPSHQ